MKNILASVSTCIDSVKTLLIIAIRKQSTYDWPAFAHSFDQ